MNIFFIKDLWWLLTSNIPKIKEKKIRTYKFKNNAKHQLETTLTIPNTKERKNVNVIGKDLVSRGARKQSLTKQFVFCKNCSFLLKYF